MNSLSIRSEKVHLTVNFSVKIVGLPVPTGSWQHCCINPSSPNSDQQQFSPNNPHTLPRDKVMRINKDYQRENALILY